MVYLWGTRRYISASSIAHHRCLEDRADHAEPRELIRHGRKIATTEKRVSMNRCIVYRPSTTVLLSLSAVFVAVGTLRAVAPGILRVVGVRKAGTRAHTATGDPWQRSAPENRAAVEAMGKAR